MVVEALPPRRFAAKTAAGGSGVETYAPPLGWLGIGPANRRSRPVIAWALFPAVAGPRRFMMAWDCSARPGFGGSLRLASSRVRRAYRVLGGRPLSLNPRQAPGGICCRGSTAQPLAALRRVVPLGEPLGGCFGPLAWTHRRLNLQLGGVVTLRIGKVIPGDQRRKP